MANIGPGAGGGGITTDIPITIIDEAPTPLTARNARLAASLQENTPRTAAPMLPRAAFSVPTPPPQSAKSSSPEDVPLGTAVGEVGLWGDDVNPQITVGITPQSNARSQWPPTPSSGPRTPAAFRQARPAAPPPPSETEPSARIQPQQLNPEDLFPETQEEGEGEVEEEKVEEEVKPLIPPRAMIALVALWIVCVITVWILWGTLGGGKKDPANAEAVLCSAISNDGDGDGGNSTGDGDGSFDGGNADGEAEPPPETPGGNETAGNNTAGTDNSTVSSRGIVPIRIDWEARFPSYTKRGRGARQMISVSVVVARVTTSTGRRPKLRDDAGATTTIADAGSTDTVPGTISADTTALSNDATTAVAPVVDETSLADASNDTENGTEDGDPPCVTQEEYDELMKVNLYFVSAFVVSIGPPFIFIVITLFRNFYPKYLLEEAEEEVEEEVADEEGGALEEGRGPENAVLDDSARSPNPTSPPEVGMSSARYYPTAMPQANTNYGPPRQEGVEMMPVSGAPPPTIAPPPMIAPPAPLPVPVDNSPAAGDAVLWNRPKLLVY